jgi:Relaxase/Mobilisation nuclease domain
LVLGDPVVSAPSSVDAKLVAWGERWDWSPLTHSQNTKPRRTHTGVLLARLISNRAQQPMTAARARATLTALVRQSPQVVVKISGGGRGLSHVMAHLNYISRGGELALENEAEDLLHGESGLQAIREAWASGRSWVPDESNRREAINIVLSMPEGTHQDAVYQSARAFARDYFTDNHEYVMVLHTFDTDPDPEPSRHPHVHLAVKVRGKNGLRLNPKKADLMEWREAFAEQLRDRGIHAVATRRRTHLQRTQGESQAVREKRRRHEKLDRLSTARPQAKAVAKARVNVRQLVRDFETLATALARSENTDDRVLAQQLGARVVERVRGDRVLAAELNKGGRER